MAEFFRGRSAGFALFSVRSLSLAAVTSLSAFSGTAFAGRSDLALGCGAGRSDLALGGGAGLSVAGGVEACRMQRSEGVLQQCGDK